MYGGDVLRPPHGTTQAAVKSNIKSEMRSFKSNENIHKKEGGSYYVSKYLFNLFHLLSILFARQLAYGSIKGKRNGPFNFISGDVYPVIFRDQHPSILKEAFLGMYRYVNVCKM